MQIISVTGFNQTNISHLAGELAVLSANRGQLTCLVDASCNPQSNLKSLLGLANQSFSYSFVDWLNKRCPIHNTLNNITHFLNQMTGEIWFIPGETESGHYGFEQIAKLCMYLEHRFDTCVICAPLGLCDEALTVTGVCDRMYAIIDLDHVQKAAVLIDIARKLNVPNIQLIVNGIPPIEFIGIQEYLYAVFQCPLAPTLSSSIGQSVLSPREIEVINLMAAGETNKSISLILGCSPRSINNIISEIYHKLGVSSRAEAVVYGVKTGL